MSSDDILVLLSKSVVNKYSSETILFKQGEKTATIWFVVTGKVKIFRVIKLPESENSQKELCLGCRTYSRLLGRSKYRQASEEPKKRAFSNPRSNKSGSRFLPDTPSVVAGTQKRGQSPTHTFLNSQNNSRGASNSKRVSRHLQDKQSEERPSNFRRFRAQSEETNSNSRLSEKTKTEFLGTNFAERTPACLRCGQPLDRSSLEEKTKQIELEILSEGAIIGAEYYFSREPYSFCALVDSPSEIISLSFDVIEKHCDLLVHQLLQKETRNYPSDEEIYEMHFKARKWEQFKKKLFQEKLYFSRQMKKERENPRGQVPKISGLPRDIVSFISEKPKPFFMKKKLGSQNTEASNSQKKSLHEDSEYSSLQFGQEVSESEGQKGNMIPFLSGGSNFPKENAHETGSDISVYFQQIDKINAIKMMKKPINDGFSFKDPSESQKLSQEHSYSNYIVPLDQTPKGNSSPEIQPNISDSLTNKAVTSHLPNLKVPPLKSRGFKRSKTQGSNHSKTALSEKENPENSFPQEGKFDFLTFPLNRNSTRARLKNQIENTQSSFPSMSNASSAKDQVILDDMENKNLMNLSRRSESVDRRTKNSRPSQMSSLHRLTREKSNAYQGPSEQGSNFKIPRSKEVLENTGSKNTNT